MGRPAIYGTAILLFAILTAVALLAGGGTFALPIVVLAVVVFGFFLANDWIARRDVERHGGDVKAVQADADDAVPTAHVIEDDATALGDTPEAHEEISPHDYPPGSPGREAAEEQAAASHGTTGGHTHGAAGGEQADTGTPGKEEGYAGGERPSSEQTRS